MVPVRSYRTPTTACPFCCAELSAAGDLHGNGHAPKPGDLTVCCFCGGVLIYQTGGTMRIASVPELAALTPDTQSQLARTQFAVLASRLRAPKPEAKS